MRPFYALLSTALLFSTAAVVSGESMEGYLMDKQCVFLSENKPPEEKPTPDGLNIFYTPQLHTGWCLLLRVCVDSGYVLMSKDPTGPDGKHEILLDLDEPLSQENVVSFIRAGSRGQFPLTTVEFDTVVEGTEGAAPLAINATFRDPWDVPDSEYFDVMKTTTQMECPDSNSPDVADNNLCFRSDIVVTSTETTYIVESNGCPDHMSMKDGSGIIPNTQPDPLAVARENAASTTTTGGGACGACGAGCGAWGPKTIEIAWEIRSYDTMKANVGDTVTFTYSPAHNVFKHESNVDSCDPMGSVLVGDLNDSPQGYTFTEDDVGSVTFTCQIPGHCQAGQLITFEVEPAETGCGACGACGAGCGACGACGAGCGACGACGAGCGACGACGAGCGACGAGCWACGAGCDACGASACDAGCGACGASACDAGCGACGASACDAGCGACGASACGAGCGACGASACDAGCGAGCGSTETGFRSLQACGAGCGACGASACGAGCGACGASACGAGCGASACDAGCGACGASACGAGCGASACGAGCGACGASACGAGCGACGASACGAGCGAGCGACGAGCGACGAGCGACGSGCDACGACGCGACGGGCGCGACGCGCGACGCGCGACGCGGCGCGSATDSYEQAPGGVFAPFLQHYTMEIPQNPGSPGDAKYFDKDDVIGLMTNGVVLDTHEATWTYDSCVGHSDKKHQYHYHLPPLCFLADMGIAVPDSPKWWINDEGNAVRDYALMADQFPATSSASPVIGFARDGYPIFSPYDENGVLIEASSGDLDECNGKVDSLGNYGYYLTPDPPFAPPCLRGDVGRFTYFTTDKACPASGVTNEFMAITREEEESSSSFRKEIIPMVIALIALAGILGMGFSGGTPPQETKTVPIKTVVAEQPVKPVDAKALLSKGQGKTSADGSMYEDEIDYA